MEASKTLAQRANQNMEASKDIAGKAHESTQNMENITREMHIIAQKTKQETVSMRIITLVTLFFLPGTFISVCRILSFQKLANGPTDTYEHKHIQSNKHRSIQYHCRIRGFKAVHCDQLTTCNCHAAGLVWRLLVGNPKRKAVQVLCIAPYEVRSLLRWICQEDRALSDDF